MDRERETLSTVVVVVVFAVVVVVVVFFFFAAVFLVVVIVVVVVVVDSVLLVGLRLVVDGVVPLDRFRRELGRHHRWTVRQTIRAVGVGRRRRRLLVVAVAVLDQLLDQFGQAVVDGHGHGRGAVGGGGSDVVLEAAALVVETVPLFQATRARLAHGPLFDFHLQVLAGPHRQPAAGLAPGPDVEEGGVGALGAAEPARDPGQRRGPGGLEEDEHGALAGLGASGLSRNVKRQRPKVQDGTNSKKKQ